MSQRVTLNRALSKLGYGSRTQALDWIRNGLVKVDGKTCTNPLEWIDLKLQNIELKDTQKPKQKTIALLLHKPPGFVTTREDELSRPTVFDLLPPDLGYLFPAGRLDFDSEGLLLFSNDSFLTNLLTDPSHKIDKTYLVTIRGQLSPEALHLLRHGIKLNQKYTRPCKVKVLQDNAESSVVEFVLNEGLNRQIRKMIHAVGSKVKKLVRTKIGKLTLDGIEPGKFRLLSPAEIQTIQQR
ncbi:MAG: rRNA pseudouridine synthase [Planctomycetes bacterium]|nr:rRNA pseudouridine synthase [Planctomycetota bacterium]